MTTTHAVALLQVSAQLQAAVCEDAQAIARQLRYTPDAYARFPGDDPLELTPETLDRIDRIIVLLARNLCQAIRDDPNLTHLGERP